MTPTKPFYLSKTVLGAIVSAVVYIAGLAGYHIADLAPQILDAVSKQIDATITIAGLVLAIYGRFDAKTQVTLGPTPSAGKAAALLGFLAVGATASVTLTGCSSTNGSTAAADITSALTAGGTILGDLTTDLIQGAITYNDAQAALKGAQQSMNGHGISTHNIGQYALAASNAANNSGVLTAAQQLEADITAQIAQGIPVSQVESQITKAQTSLTVPAANSTGASTGTATPTGTTTLLRGPADGGKFGWSTGELTDAAK